MPTDGLSPMLLMVCADCRQGTNGDCFTEGCVISYYHDHGGPLKPARTREAMIAAAELAIVARVDDRLAFNVAAYGRAWTGETEDTKFIVGTAAEEALIAAGVIQSEEAAA